jgi:hypothetical protein
MACRHNMGSTWGPWIYVEGVTSGMMYRDRTCNGCGKVLQRQTKSV